MDKCKKITGLIAGMLMVFIIIPTHAADDFGAPFYNQTPPGLAASPSDENTGQDAKNLVAENQNPQEGDLAEELNAIATAAGENETKKTHEDVKE